MNKFLIIIILVLLIWMYKMCKKSKNTGSSPVSSQSNFLTNLKSKFNESMSSSDDKKDNINSDTVLIFYAPWCGHCKKSLPDFKKAVSEGDNIIMINSDDEPELTKKYDVKGFPTIMKSSGEKYTGGRDTSSILNFATN